MRSGTVVVGAGARRRVGSTVVGRVDASGGTSDAQCEVCYAGCDVACFYHHFRYPMCSFECRSESSFESSFECSFFRSFPVARRCRVRFRVCDVRCCMCDVRCCHFGIFVICWLFDSHSSSHSGSRFDSRFDSHFDSHLVIITHRRTGGIHAQERYRAYIPPTTSIQKQQPITQTTAMSETWTARWSWLVACVCL